LFIFEPAGEKNLFIFEPAGEKNLFILNIPAEYVFGSQSLGIV